MVSSMLSWRIQKRHVWLVVVLLFLETAYVIGGNWFLRSPILPQLLNGNPQSLFLHYNRAYTFVPGLVHVRGFWIEGQQGTTKWHAEVERFRVFINVPLLLARRFQVLSVKGEGGDFRLIAHMPKPIPEAPKPSDDKPKSPPFRVDIQNIRIDKFSTIAIHDYLFRGDATVGGSFFLWPGRELQIPRGVVQFHSGRVLLQEKDVTSELSGEVDASIRDYFPKVHSAADILDKVTAHVTLKGELENADFLNHYFGGIPWLQLFGVSGRFDADAHIEDGQFIGPSRLEIEARRLGAALADYRAEGGGSAKWRHLTENGKPVIRMDAKLTGYQALAPRSKAVILTGKELDLRFDNRNLRLRTMFSDISDVSASVTLPSARVTDLRFANDFIPSLTELELLEGTASVEAQLNVSTKGSAPPGYLRLVAQSARARYKSTLLSGTASLEATLTDTDEGTDRFKVSKAKLKLSRVHVQRKRSRNAREDADWTGELAVPSAMLAPRHHIIAAGTAEVTLDDARPVLNFLSVDSAVARIVKQATEMRNIRGHLGFELGRGIVNLSDVTLDSSDVNLRARLRLTRGDRRLLAYLKYKLFEIGLSAQRGKRSTKWKGARKWFDAQPPWDPIPAPQAPPPGQ